MQPVMRLESKIRVGSKLQRRYDLPATPYQRLLDSGQLSVQARRQLQQQYDAINPVALMKQIQQRQTELLGRSATPTWRLRSPAKPNLIR